MLEYIGHIAVSIVNSASLALVTLQEDQREEKEFAKIFGVLGRDLGVWNAKRSRRAFD